MKDPVAEADAQRERIEHNRKALAAGERSPISARHWRSVRHACAKREGRECHYPWCRCTPVVPAEGEHAA